MSAAVVTPPPTPYVTAPFTVAIDDRERIPFVFSSIRTDTSDRRGGNRPVIVPSKVVHLATADYSLVGYESRVGVERKSLSDAFSTFGGSRARFTRELERLNAMEVAHVVVEADWRTVLDAWPTSLRDCAAYLRLATEAGPTVGTAPAEIVAWANAIETMCGRPPERSQLNPKTIWRSVNAWEQRYPHVHFHFLPDRAWAEAKTYRILERFHNDVTSGKRATPTTHVAAPDSDVAAALADIDDAINATGDLPDRAADFAESVVAKLESIRSWIEEHDDVTAAQREAVANMAAGIERWKR